MSELSELKSKYGHNKELKAKMNAGIVGMRSVEMKLMWPLHQLMEESRQCVDSSWIQTATLMTNSLHSFPMMMARSETSLFPL